MGSIRRKDTKRRRGYIKAIKRAYKTRKTMSKYGQITLFTEQRSVLCQRDIEHLKIWVKKYNILAAEGTRNLINDQERGDITEVTRIIGADSEGHNLNHRPNHHFTKSYLRKMICCTDCDRNVGMGEGWISGSIPSTLIPHILSCVLPNLCPRMCRVRRKG